MALLPSLATTFHSNIANCFTKALSRHRFTTTTLIGDIHHPPTTSVAMATAAAPTVASTVVASTSDSVPPLHPNLAPTHPNIVLDTRASFSIVSFASDFIPAPFGLIRSATSAVSKIATQVTSTPVDPYTLITGEDTTTSDLSSPDPVDLDSDSVDTFDFASAFEVLEFQEFGTATLIFISDPKSELESILVEPTLDWFDWVPLPRLTPTESYFHLLGFDYIEVFALLHLYPLWIALLYLSVSALFALIRSK